LCGVLLLLASGGTTLVHRSIWEAARHGPAQAVEFGIALMTFTLASIGMLLVINGGRLFAQSKPDRGSRDRRGQDLLVGFLQPVRSQGCEFDTRRGVARLQAVRAIEAARGRFRLPRNASALR
jgi:hypothetical protein